MPTASSPAAALRSSLPFAVDPAKVTVIAQASWSAEELRRQFRTPVRSEHSVSEAGQTSAPLPFAIPASDMSSDFRPAQRPNLPHSSLSLSSVPAACETLTMAEGRAESIRPAGSVAAEEKVAA